MVNVVIGIVIKEDKILLIKRERGDFPGLWAIPGGKVEECEHLNEAIEREMFEEIGIKMQFKELLGFSTEIMHDKEKTSMLYICQLEMNPADKITNPEFEYKFFSKDEIINSDNIVKSDKLFIKTFYIDKSTTYLPLDCYKDDNGRYYWKQFD